MVMDENKKTKKNRFKSKSFYLVAGLCILAAGTGIWGAILTSGNTGPSVGTTTPRSTIDWENYGGRTLPTEDAQVNIPATNIPDDRGSVTTSKQQQSTTVVTTTQDTKNMPYTGSFALPMGTDILKDYSQGEMVRSKTMGDWRLHNGIDFRGAAGNDIAAIQNGTVKKVYTDPLWGTVVEIQHGNGLLAKYCGLQQNSAPTVGKAVKQYDVVGKLGTIPIEQADEPHLHLEITVNGKIVDPLLAINRAGEPD